MRMTNRSVPSKERIVTGRHKTAKGLASETFHATSFIGTDIGDPTSPLAETPPRSARHVVSVAWSWSPMHSRASQYRLATDRARKTWNLYELTYDPDARQRLSSRVATGTPYFGISPEHAALELLRTAWQSEMEQWDFNPNGVEVEEDGLLTQEDIAELVAILEWTNTVEWFSHQSKSSLSTLRAFLPDSLDEALIERLDEIQCAAQELKLSEDFLTLCAYYKISDCSLDSLIPLLSRDATVARERRELEESARVQKYRREIDLLVRDMSTDSLRGGGMAIPSLQLRVRQFLENYVSANAALPTGEHKVNKYFGPTLNFDELRNRYGL
jgi:hypothetical protein